MTAMLLTKSASNTSQAAFHTTQLRPLSNQHFPSNETTIELNPQLRHQLDVAKQKLQATHEPWLLRVTFYLRILCNVIQKSSVPVDALEQNHSPKKITYSQLMQSLFNYHPEWWKQCKATKTGTLVSDNPTINALLSPLNSIL